MRYLSLVNLKYIAFFLAETDVYKKYDVKLLTEDARFACAAVSRSVSLMQVKSIAECEHSAILSTFTKLPFVIKIVALSIFEWPLKTGFTTAESHVT